MGLEDRAPCDHFEEPLPSPGLAERALHPVERRARQHRHEASALSRLQLIQESTDQTPRLVDDVADLKEDRTAAKAEVSVIKQVVGDHSKRLTGCRG